MRSTWRWIAVAVACGPWLAACAGGATGELAGQPGLLSEVQQYYDRYAIEEGGLCSSPRLGLVTGSSVQEQSHDRLVVRVSYLYTDPAAKAGPPGAKGPRQCRGFGSRSFTVARRADGFEVLEMTGSQQRGIKIIKFGDR